MMRWMRRGLARATLGAGLLMAVMAGRALAQDPLTVAPEVYTKLLENNRIRVLQAEFKPGAKSPMHSLAEHLLYLPNGGTLVLAIEGKTPYEMAFTPGQVLLLPAQKRATENTGDKAVRALIVEFKTAAAAPARTSRKPRRGGKRPRS